MDLIQPYYLVILFEAHTPYMLFYIDLLRNDALLSLEIVLTVPIPPACTAVVDNADITKAVNDFKIVDLRIMYSPNSSSHTGIQYQSLYYTILYRVHLFSCRRVYVIYNLIYVLIKIIT